MNQDLQVPCGVGCQSILLVDQGLSEEEQNDRAKDSKRKRTLLVGFLLTVVALTFGLGVGLSRDGAATIDDLLLPRNGMTTLELVKTQGYVRCGISEFDFVKFVEDTEGTQYNRHLKGPHMEGFSVEQCRAMALLALGNPNLYELVLFDVDKRFVDLKEGRLDIMPDGSTHTTERDLWVAGDTKAAYSFSVPYFYSGLTFAGQPTYVDCVDPFDSFSGECRNLRICVSAGSTHEDVLGQILQGSVLVFGDTEDEQIAQYRLGDCYVIAGENLLLWKLPSDITVEFKYSKQVVSKEPLCIVTRNDDPEWSDLVNLIVNTWIIAEAFNITKATASLVSDLFETDTSLPSLVVVSVEGFRRQSQ